MIAPTLEKRLIVAEIPTIMTPAKYAQKHNLKPTVAAYELAMTENGFRKQGLATKNRRSPSAQSCRIAQLLDFIKEAGLEPPAPYFFD